MPKMKTKSSAKKRFRVRGSGSVKRAMAFKRHILTKKIDQEQAAACAAPPASMRRTPDRSQAMLPYA